MMRAVVSAPPPGGNPTNRRTGRDGYACALADPDTIGSAAAPAARCRNCLRWGSFILHLPLASHYSITSSARASNVGGTSKPKALAVFRLTTNSNLVPCCTGSSAGIAPLMILSTKLAERYHMSLTLEQATRLGHLPGSADQR